jgi:hypothetical protein
MLLHKSYVLQYLQITAGKLSINPKKIVLQISFTQFWKILTTNSFFVSDVIEHKLPQGKMYTGTSPKFLSSQRDSVMRFSTIFFFKSIHTIWAPDSPTKAILNMSLILQKYCQIMFFLVSTIRARNFLNWIFSILRFIHISCRSDSSQISLVV